MTDPGVVRVVVADDQDLIRAGLAMILDAQPDLEVVGEAADGLQAVAVVRGHRPGRRTHGRPHAGVSIAMA